MPPKGALTKWTSKNTLPSNLMEALNELGRDKLIKDTLGESMYRMYRDIKKREWEEYQTQVTEWEKEQYLDRY